MTPLDRHLSDGWRHDAQWIFHVVGRRGREFFTFNTNSGAVVRAVDDYREQNALVLDSIEKDCDAVTRAIRRRNDSEQERERAKIMAMVCVVGMWRGRCLNLPPGRSIFDFTEFTVKFEDGDVSLTVTVPGEDVILDTTTLPIDGKHRS